MSEYSRGACSARVAVRVEEHAVDDVDDAVREEDVWLDDLGGHVARGDVVPGRVQHERERLARCGRVVLGRQERGVDGAAVDDLPGRRRCIVRVGREDARRGLTGVAQMMWW